jgi:hypothetical protein
MTVVRGCILDGSFIKIALKEIFIERSFRLCYHVCDVSHNRPKAAGERPLAKVILPLSS